MEGLARVLIIVGVALLLVGGVIFLALRLFPALGSLRLGQLPGDIRFGSGNATCVIALGTSILLSIVFTVVLNIIARFLNR